MGEPDWRHHEQVAERLVRERATDWPRDPSAPLILGPPRDNGTMYLSRVNAKALVRILDAERAKVRALVEALRMFVSMLPTDVIEASSKHTNHSTDDLPRSLQNLRTFTQREIQQVRAALKAAGEEPQ